MQWIQLIIEKVGINVKNTEELQKITEEIEETRVKLNKLVSGERDTLVDEDIVKISQLLDQLLVKYYILK